MIDLVELRNEIKKGVFVPFVKKEKLYLEDAQNGECIMICDLETVSNEKLIT